MLVDRRQRARRPHVLRVDRKHALVTALRARGLADLVLENARDAQTQLDLELARAGAIRLARQHVDQAFEIARALVQHLERIPLARGHQTVAQAAQRAALARIDLQDAPPYAAGTVRIAQPVCVQTAQLE